LTILVTPSLLWGGKRDLNLCKSAKTRPKSPKNRKETRQKKTVSETQHEFSMEDFGPSNSYFFDGPQLLTLMTPAHPGNPSPPWTSKCPNEYNSNTILLGRMCPSLGPRVILIGQMKFGGVFGFWPFFGDFFRRFWQHHSRKYRPNCDQNGAAAP